MIEIIALIFLTINIVKLAKQKGESPLKWGVRGVMAWLLGEFVGIALIVILVGQELLYCMIVGIGMAYLFFLLLKSSLSSKPDINEADIT
jgi:hypothetical protein